MQEVPGPDVIEWLLEGDVAIQYQTRRDLLDEDRPDLQARIATEGWGARFLATQNDDTSWGREFYQPKWISSHYTLLDLKNLGISPDTGPVRQSIAHILAAEKRPDGGLGPAKGNPNSDICVAGMALNYASYFGMPAEDLRSLVDFILSEKLPDGGFNCMSNHAVVHHSSLHSTISVLEGFQQFLRSGYSHRAEGIRAAMETSRKFILMHKLFRSDHTGKVISPAFLKWPYPFRWKYNILRALDHFATARIPYDPRLQEALDYLVSKRTADGRWKVNSAHPGQQHFVMEPAGKPSRWITLMASRVLRFYTQ